MINKVKKTTTKKMPGKKVTPINKVKVAKCY